MGVPQLPEHHALEHMSPLSEKGGHIDRAIGWLARVFRHSGKSFDSEGSRTVLRRLQYSQLSLQHVSNCFRRRSVSSWQTFFEFA